MATKKKRPAVKELVANNTAVNAAELKRATQELKKLRDAGFERPQYDLAMPYRRRSAHSAQESPWH